MRRHAVWFWPLFLALPVALAVVIKANQGITWQADGLKFLAVSLFSYTFYYFGLSWAVWLMRWSWVKRLVVSALVPVGVLLLLAVLPLGRPMDLAALQSPVMSFMYWFIPGEFINRKLDHAVVSSPCTLPMWEARQKRFGSHVRTHTFLPDGRILIVGSVFKPGRDLSALKLVRLLPDGSIDPAFKAHAGCIQDQDQGLFLPQADGRLLVSRLGLDSTPYGPEKLALVVSPEGEAEREVYVPRLSKEQLVWGRIVDLQLEPGGGLTAYGYFKGKNTEFRSIRLRLTAEGAPDLSSGMEVPGLDGVDAITRDADGRFIINSSSTRQDQPALFALTADGQFEEAFQTRLLEAQREHGLLRVQAMAAQADGKLVAVVEKQRSTYELVRLHRDGSLDTSFQRTPVPARANHVSVFADGSILVARIYNSHLMSSSDSADLMRLGPDGRLDEAITQRIRNACAAQKVKSISSLAVKPDGTVLLSRSEPIRPGEEKLRLLVQLRPDGSLDPHFQPPF